MRKLKHVEVKIVPLALMRSRARVAKLSLEVCDREIHCGVS